MFSVACACLSHHTVHWSQPPCTGPWPIPPLHMFKGVQLEPHCTGTPIPRHIQTCLLWRTYGRQSGRAVGILLERILISQVTKNQKVFWQFPVDSKCRTIEESKLELAFRIFCRTGANLANALFCQFPKRYMRVKKILSCREGEPPPPESANELETLQPKGNHKGNWLTEP